ncbi:hypothetical protein GCM10023108_08810 [Saccharopolyspora hordei]
MQEERRVMSSLNPFAPAGAQPSCFVSVSDSRKPTAVLADRQLRCSRPASPTYTGETNGRSP